MSTEFDFSQCPDDPTQIQNGGGDRPSPGRGMVLITKWEEYAGANGEAHVLEFEIVAWTTPADVGMSHKENFFHKDTTGKGFPQKRRTCLAMAAGLFSTDDVIRWKKNNEKPLIDMQKLAGRPIMIELVEEPNKKDPTKRPYLNIGNIGLAMYHIKDPRVKDWPMNQGIFNRMAATVGNWGSSEAPAAKPDPPTGASNPFGNV